MISAWRKKKGRALAGPGMKRATPWPACDTHPRDDDRHSWRDDLNSFNEFLDRRNKQRVDALSALEFLALEETKQEIRPPASRARDQLRSSRLRTSQLLLRWLSPPSPLGMRSSTRMR